MKKVTYLLALSLVLTGQSWAASMKDGLGRLLELPSQPKRLVCLSEVCLDSALALGITPVGATRGRGQPGLPAYLEPHLKNSPVVIVGDLGKPHFESVLKLQPDLVISGPIKAEQLKLMQKIAPTAVAHLRGEDWQTAFRRVAKLVNRPRAAENWLQNYHKQVQQVRESLAAIHGNTVSIVRWHPKGPAYMYKDAFASLVLQDLGLKRPTTQTTPGVRHSMPISLEALQVIDADWLFMGTLQAKGDAAQALGRIAREPMFKELKAVSKGHYKLVDGSQWTSLGGPVAALSIVTEASDFIAARVLAH